MIRSLCNLTIRGKLSLLLVILSGSLLSVAAGSFLAVELFRQAVPGEFSERTAATFLPLAAAICLFFGFASFLLASWLQRLISQPLAEQRDRELEEANILLEQRVKERTEALRESESSLRSLFENSPVSLWSEDFSAVKAYLDHLRKSGIDDMDAFFREHPGAVEECARLIRVLDVNQATLRLLKAESKQELLGSLDGVFLAESYGQFREELVALSQGKTRIEIEGVNRTIDGEQRFVNMCLSVVPGHEETLSKVIVSLVDLTERRKVEQSLRVLEKAFETTRVGITIADLEGKIVFANPAEASMHGYEIEDLPGRSVNCLGPPELRSTFPGVNVQNSERESLNIRKDGSRFPVRLISDLVVDAGGNPLSVVTVCEDITERKETEARLKASIAEKEVLLKEVHHRVKNNLQVISSLINLQLKKITEPRTRAELNATRNRIRSMALIHAQLYQSENLSQINFAEYLQEFSRQIRSLYDVSPNKVRLLFDIDEVYLDVDVAIPCGMIINELLTNALKYAFPEDRTGEIRVRLRLEAKETVLSVEDTGVGLPAEIELSRVETLGLQLVRGLAQQVNGSVIVERNGGTRVIVRFPGTG